MGNKRKRSIFDDNSKEQTDLRPHLSRNEWYESVKRFSTAIENPFEPIVGKPSITITKPEDILFILDEFSDYGRATITTNIMGNDKVVNYKVAALSEFTDLEKVYASIRNKINNIAFMDIMPPHIEDPESFMVVFDRDSIGDKLGDLNSNIFNAWSKQIHDFIPINTDKDTLKFTLIDYQRGMNPNRDYVVDQLRSLEKSGNLDLNINMPE